MSFRGVLTQRITWQQAAWSIGLIVALPLSLLAGHRVLPLLVLVVGLIGPSAVALLQRRRHPAQIARLQHTVHLGWEADAIWALIEPAENAPMLDDDIRRGYRVPGTPDGVGQQQAFERHDGFTIIIEVVEYQQGRRAVTRQVSPPDDTLRLVQSVAPVDGGCEYTIGVELELRAGQWVRPAFEKSWRANAMKQTARTQKAMKQRRTDATS